VTADHHDFVFLLAAGNFADDVDSAFKLLETGLTKYYLEPDKETPSIAKSRV